MILYFWDGLFSAALAVSFMTRVIFSNKFPLKECKLLGLVSYNPPVLDDELTLAVFMDGPMFRRKVYIIYFRTHLAGGAFVDFLEKDTPFTKQGFFTNVTGWGKDPIMLPNDANQHVQPTKFNLFIVF